MRAQWVQTNGLGGKKVLCLAVSGSDIFAGSQSDGVYHSTNYGANWLPINNGLPNTAIYDIKINGDNIYLGTYGGGIFISTNKGTEWIPVNNGLKNKSVQTIAVSGNNIFAGTYSSGVYLSTNNGTNWTQVNNGLSDFDVVALVGDGTNIFASTWGKGVYRSTNNGTNWTHVFDGGVANTVLKLVISGINIFAGSAYTGYLSTNQGINWTQLALPKTFSFAIKGTSIFAGTSDGVYRSTNNGTNWTSVNNGLTQTYILSIVIGEANLFAGTLSGGVWTRPLSEFPVGVSKEGNESLQNFLLNQNYPNPFNPETKINYSIPKTSFVSVKVYNMLGFEITTLIKEEKPMGTYEATFNAANLPSGVYFYRLQAGSFIDTKKMILLK